MSSKTALSYFTPHTERFFFICGNTDDEFCTPPLEVLTLKEAICRHLRALGYRRCVLYDGRLKIHFPDEEARSLSCSGRDNAGEVPYKTTSGQSRVNVRSPGPLGGRRLNRRKETLKRSTTEPETSSSSPLHLGRMSDMDVVSALNRWMKEEHCPTAVIFTNGLDFVHHFQAEAVRHMAGCLNDWNGLIAGNRNVVIFLFPNLNLQRLNELKQSSPQWELLWSKLMDISGEAPKPGRGAIAVGAPRQDEVESLLHHERLLNKLSVDWCHLPEAVPRIARRLAAQGKNGQRNDLKTLHVKLSNFSKFTAQELNDLCGGDVQEDAMQRLKQLRGLEVVVERVEKLIRHHREQIEEAVNQPEVTQDANVPARLLPTPPSSGQKRNLHLALMGNPGTGKTTAARLIAEIYRDAGLLPSGHLVEVQREDLVAGYVGQTALRTAQRIADAMGGVLFVDEAYRLTEGGENDFGKEAVETIMGAMSNHSDELAVIVAGYPQRTNEFLNANPGLHRRVGEQNMLTISDYEPKLLRYIFEHRLKAERRHIDPGLRERLDDFFANWYGARDLETFGNAGDVHNLYEAMDQNRAHRVADSGLTGPERWTLTVEDVPDTWKTHLRTREAPTVEAVLESLDDMVGLWEVKTWLCQLARRIHLQQARQQRNLSDQTIWPGHYIFVGKPGTGKTVMARKLGAILNLLGIVGRREVTEVGPTDLVDPHVSATAGKAEAVYRKALNGVLFIDEAHQLADGHGPDAVRALVPFMLNNRERLCVIVAGYPGKMDRFLAVDPGLKSRFSQIIDFPDYGPDELWTIFAQELQKSGEVAGPGLEVAVRHLFELWEMNKKADFGNARDVHKLLDQMRLCRDERVGSLGLDAVDLTDEDLQTLLPEDLPLTERERLGSEVANSKESLENLNELSG